jgi:hypothetical protein
VSSKNPKFPFCGTVKKAAAAGNQVRGKKKHPICFDLFPSDCNIVVLPREPINVLMPGEDEPEYDEKQARIDAMLEHCEHPNLPSKEYGSEDDVASVELTADDDDDVDPEEQSSKNKKKKKKPRAVLEMERFLNEQFESEIAKATSYKHFYGEGDDQFIEWTILQEGEAIVEDVMKPPPPTNTPFGLHIPWSRYPKDMNYTDIFFSHFFPSLQGKAAVLDEFLSSPFCSCNVMVRNDNIRFHCPERSDPDFIVSDRLPSFFFQMMSHTSHFIIASLLFTTVENMCDSHDNSNAGG